MVAGSSTSKFLENGTLGLSRQEGGQVCGENAVLGSVLPPTKDNLLQHPPRLATEDFGRTGASGDLDETAQKAPKVAAPKGMKQGGTGDSVCDSVSIWPSIATDIHRPPQKLQPNSTDKSLSQRR